MTDNNNNSSNSNSNNNAVIMTMPLPLESTRPATTLPRPSWFVIQLTITASLGGCLFGYDLGAISGTLSQLTTTFDLNNSQKELIVSILYMGGTIGAACGGSVCDRIGRKTSILLTDIIFIIGSLWLYFSSSYEQVIIGRFIIGIGIAISGIADVSYLHECSPIQYRGSIVSVNEACISLGFLLAYISGFIFSSHEKEEWRIVFGIAGFLAAIQFIGMLLLPESPEWLLEKGRLDDAKKASERINGTAYCKSSTDGIFLGSRVEGDTTDAGVFSSDGPTALIRRKSRSRQQKNNSIAGVLEKNPMINSPILLRADDDYGTDSIIMTDSKGKIKEVNSSSLFGSRESLFKTTTTTATTDSNDNPTIAAYHNNQSTRSFGFSIRHRIESIVMILSQYRRQVYIALYLAIVQQLCGQTNILNYAPLIFEEATNQDNNEQQEQQQQNYNENNNDYYEYPEDDASLLEDDWSMVIIGVVKFIVTILVIWKIEYIGRRRLLIFGNLLIAIGLLALIIAFGGSSSSSSSSSSSTITASTNDDNGDDDVVVVDNDDDDSSASTTFWSPLTNVKTFHLALPGVLLVVCGYSCSFGPLTWLLTSEIFPTDIRGRALGASTIVSYMFGAISTQTFLFATSRYGPSFVFGMYCIITVCGVFFVYMAIPDTGEKTVQEIDDSLNDMPWWKYDPKILLPQYDSSTTPPPSLEMTSEQFSTTNNNASTRTSSSSSLDQQHVLS